MTFKTAFRFQNRLDYLIKMAQDGLKDKFKAEPYARALLLFLAEKEKIYRLCSEVKKNLDIDIDVQKTVNSCRHHIAKNLAENAGNINDPELKAQIKQLSEYSKDISEKLEEALLTSEIDYEPPFDEEDGLDEIVKGFIF